jgi:hypothetical protein
MYFPVLQWFGIRHLTQQLQAHAILFQISKNECLVDGIAHHSFSILFYYNFVIFGTILAFLILVTVITTTVIRSGPAPLLFVKDLEEIGYEFFKFGKHL